MNELYVNIKIRSTKNNTKDLKGFEFRTIVVREDRTINDTNAIQYEFVNMCDTDVMINDFRLTRYSDTGFNSSNSWKPEIEEGEYDATIYKIRFLPTRET